MLVLENKKMRLPEWEKYCRQVLPEANTFFTFTWCSFGVFMHFCPGSMKTEAESINSNLQRGLDRRLRHITTLNTEQYQLAFKVSADN